MNRYVQTFLACILLHMILPFLPLIVAALFTGRIDNQPLVLAASMYCIALGISSRNPGFFALTLFLAVGYALIFGWLSDHPAPQRIRGVISWGLVAVFVLHAIERYNRHVVDRAPFFEFVRQ